MNALQFITKLTSIRTLLTILSPTLVELAIALNVILTPQGAIAAPWKVTYRPPNRGAPGSNGAGASRPACRVMPKPVAALAPIESNWGETLEGHPSLWFYQPYQGVSVQLTLVEEQSQMVIFAQNYASNQGSGITKLEIPETAPELEIDKLYRWKIEFVCNARTQQQYAVSGVIVRRAISDKLKCQINHATPEERITLLAEKGLWYDTVNELATLRRSHPDDPIALETWQQLLSQPEVKLERWKNEPLIN